jgi:glucose-6-phosphate-specific signal transduction histidine kinase
VVGRGLRAALETVAERSVLPVDMSLDVGMLDQAARIAVRTIRTAARVPVEVRDDGTGGADPTGGGLTGLARRVAALDGTMSVDSPPGGPTVVVAEMPCG